MPNTNPPSTFIGVALAGPAILAAVVSEDGKLIDRREATLDCEHIVEQIAQIVSQLHDHAPGLKSIGVAIPGLVNRMTDRVVASREFPATVRDDLHEELMRATGLRCELENDANAAAYGEYKVGAGHGSRDMFYMSIGDGIGGAIILGGKLWTGASGLAGEVGHITIDAEGPDCVCGNAGCLETVASAPNIVRRAKERLDRDSTSSLARLAMSKEFTADDIAREAKNEDD